MDVKIEESWKALLQEEFDKPYFAELIAFVKNEYAQTRILTTVPDRRTAFVFPCPKVSSNRLPCKIYLKKYTMTWVLLFPVRATWNAGRTRGYCCSMQRLPYGPTKPVRTRTKAGKLSPMPLSARSQKRKNTWYSCCGDPMPNAKAHLSIPTGTWYLNAYTPPRFPLTGADGSAITSSATQINIYGNMG